jgi:hypothetical protein
MDPQNSSVGAVSRIAREAESAQTASRIYFTDHALADDLRTIRRNLDNTDKLMPYRARESGIAANDLEIGIAYAGPQNAHKCLAAGFRNRNLGDERASCVHLKCLHSFPAFSQNAVNLLNDNTLLYFPHLGNINQQ